MIGGLGTLEGPIIGTLIFFLLNKFLSDFGTWYLVGLGALAIVVTMFFPQGIWGYVSRRFGWQLFPVARHVVFLDRAPSSTRGEVIDTIQSAHSAPSAPHP
jgi:branched-chain amino acid transport system permease protein